MSRYKYIDYLKMIAIFAVIVIHVLGDRYYYTFQQGKSWYFLLFFASLVRFGVPIFVMCSGALLLDENKQLDIKKMIKNIIKYILIFLITAILYAIFDFFVFQDGQMSGEYILDKIINFKYHLWYIPTLILLYIITPFLKLALKKENKKIIEYTLLIFFIVILINSVANNPIHEFKILKAIMTFVPTSLISYIWIYVTGWYLSTFTLPTKVQKTIIIVGLISYFISPFLNIALSVKTSTKQFLTSDNFNVLNYIFSCGIFLLFKSREEKLASNRIVKSISINTLYMYLVHVAIIELIQYFVLDKIAVHSYWWILVFPLVTIIVCAISYLFSFTIQFIINKIKKNKKNNKKCLNE